MAYTKSNKSGTRHTGYYRSHDGTRKSAGTFDTHEEAMAKAQQAEEHGDRDYPPAMTIKAWSTKYLDDTLTLGERTKRDYRSYYERFINPNFGDRLVGEVTRPEVRRFLEGLYKTGTGASTINHVKCALACIYKPLVDDDMLTAAPTDRIPAFNSDKRQIELVHMDEYQLIRDKLPTEGARVFTDFLISLGLRFGEATEVRPKDLTTRRGVTTLHVQRVVSDVGAPHNEGSRFKVLKGTKGKWNARKTRVVPVPPGLAVMLHEWIEANSIGDDSLLFPIRLVDDRPKRMSMGNTTGHLPRDTWRRIWIKAAKDAKIGWIPRTHDLRHACASLYLANGATLQDVKEILGHGQISTTEKYLHALNRDKQKDSTPFDALWADKETA